MSGVRGALARARKQESGERCCLPRLHEIKGRSSLQESRGELDHSRRGGLAQDLG